MDWYVLRVMSGREEVVAKDLESRAQAAGLTASLSKVLIPMERVSEIRSGKKRVFERKIFPGYIMVHMEVNEGTWYLIRETPGIGDFVGSSNKPLPMPAHEVDRILASMEEKQGKPKPKIEFHKGESVKIKEGPFENFDGVVDEVNTEKGTVNIIVSIFGRPTPVELEYWQVEPL
ncbi:MAG: transcription termination/antitermination protein NusG [Planctomycetota bacterium]